mgnify:CR=1 FL=1
MTTESKAASLLKSRWIDVGLIAACLVVFGMIVQRLQVRRQPLPVASAPASFLLEAEDGVTQLDFQTLERVQPDEQMRPIFSPGMLAMDGERVRIQGFMSPFESLRDMSTFMLFSFPTGCNFCAPPAINQVVLVRQKPGKDRYPFVDAPIVVTGTLRLRLPDRDDPAFVNDGFIYLLEDTEVVALEMDPIQLRRFHREHAAQGRLPGL